MKKLALLFLIGFATSAISAENWHSNDQQLHPQKLAPLTIQQVQQAFPKSLPQKPSPSPSKPSRYREHQSPAPLVRTSNRPNVSNNINVVKDDQWYSHDPQLHPKKLTPPTTKPSLEPLPKKSSPTQPKKPRHRDHQSPAQQVRTLSRLNVLDYDNIVEEKQFQPLTVGTDLFWMDSTKGELWKFDRENKRWEFLGRPRGANSKRKGTYLLTSLAAEGLLILDTNSGEAWWTLGDGAWVAIDDPSTRTWRGKD